VTSAPFLRGFVVVATALGLASLPDLADAQSSAAHDTEAHGLFDAGSAAFEDGRFEDAYRYFTRSHELSGRPELLFSLASTCERLRRDAEAVGYYERYLVAIPDAANRRFVEGRLEFLRRPDARPAPTTTDPPALTVATADPPPSPAEVASRAATPSASASPIDAGSALDDSPNRPRRTRRIVAWTVAAVVVASAATTALVLGLREPGVQAPLAGDVGPGGIIIALGRGGL